MCVVSHSASVIWPKCVAESARLWRSPIKNCSNSCVSSLFLTLTKPAIKKMVAGCGRECFGRHCSACSAWTCHVVLKCWWTCWAKSSRV